MKKIIFVIVSAINLILSINEMCVCQTPNWLWAKSEGGPSVNYNERAFSVATDSSRNVYVTGYFMNQVIIFGNDTLYNTNQTAGNSQDAFVVKYNEFGNVIWAKSAGGVDNDRAYSICVDNTGNIIITGYFYSPFIIFDTDTLYKTGVCDLFIVKYDSVGNLIWAKSAGDLGSNIHYFATFSIASDLSSNIIITGSFKSSSLIFGTDTLVNDSMPMHDMFIAKFDATGNSLWAKRAGESKNEFSNSIVTDSQNNIIVTGLFSSSQIIFGSDTLIKYVTGGAAFTVKYDSNGNEIWAKSYQNGSHTSDEGISITTDGTDKIIITGDFNNFGTGGIFIQKYSPVGNVIWTQTFGQNWGSGANAITADDLGNIFLTGFYNSPTITFGTTVLNNNAWITGTSDVFIVKYDSSGIVQWATSVGGTEMDQANAITTDNNKDIIVTGFYQQSTIAFGPFILPVSGLEQMFATKLGNGITGIHNQTMDFTLINVYPNPFSSFITVTIPLRNVKQVSYSVRNTLGQVVFLNYDDNLNISYLKTIDLSFLPKGIYLLDIIIDGERTVKKIVK